MSTKIKGFVIHISHQTHKNPNNKATEKTVFCLIHFQTFDRRSNTEQY